MVTRKRSYSNGNSAAGMHGASVSMSHNKGSSAMESGIVTASHTLTETATDNSRSTSTAAFWPN